MPAVRSRCSYQRQTQGDKPEVWITAHDMLFHAQPAFGRPAAVIIDERMWHKGILGIEDEEKWEVPLDSLIMDGTERIDSKTASGRLAHYRNRLGRALMKQDDNGGVRRKHLDAALSPYDCDIARKLEWKLLPELGQHPGMSEAEIAALESNMNTIDTIQHTRRVIQIWEAVGDLLKDPGIKVSGCLTLRQSNGQRVVAWKGVDQIRKQFQVPTLLLDATLPPLPLLQVYHPQVEMTADIRAAMPAHTRNPAGDRSADLVEQARRRQAPGQHAALHPATLDRDRTRLHTGGLPAEGRECLTAARAGCEHHAGALQQHRR